MERQNWGFDKVVVLLVEVGAEDGDGGEAGTQWWWWYLSGEGNLLVHGGGSCDGNRRQRILWRWDRWD